MYSMQIKTLSKNNSAVQKIKMTQYQVNDTVTTNLK